MKRMTWAVLLALSLPAGAAPLALENAQWKVELEPQTLALRVQPQGQGWQPVSGGVGAHAVTGVQAGPAAASWSWDDGGWQWRARLDGADLRLEVKARQPGELALLAQPAASLGRALMLPLAEGSYVPAGDKLWRDYLLQQDEVDTSEGLSLPLWTVDHGGYTLSWLLEQPFANRLKFVADGDGLALALSHRFTRLNLEQGMAMTLHLGAADPLAGARRYRSLLQQRGSLGTLTQAIAAVPDTARLLGASHVYLWGDGLLDVRDVADWGRWLAVLRGQDALAVALRGRFDKEARAVLASAPARPDRTQRRVLLAAFNQALNDEVRAQWLVDAPDWQALGGVYRAARQQVAALFGPALQADPATWGGGLSGRTVAALRQAGLSRLWLGVDNWEAGLWNPQAVKAGVDAGYLMGTYDSYQTALPPGQRADWLTAQLGRATYRDCGVELEGGKLKTGFQGKGYYTNPRCARPVLEARVTALQQATGFNSWFLDAYGFGMAFDDYRQGQTMSQAQMAEGYADNMEWVGQALKLPVGSESGNATTRRGMVFAHGMQVPVMGWGDADLQKNPSSPYFLGRWYPARQPEVFFRRVPLKEPYRSLFYAPQYRLPLYQVVFHGSVITTNHWSYDNFKFSNADSDNLLAQMLYNVPPLYHLSADTLDARLPAMACVDRFFRPLHQRLGTQALQAWEPLLADRQLQRTRFADGSEIVVNFGADPQRVGQLDVAPRSVVARLADGTQYRLVAGQCRPE